MQRFLESEPRDSAVITIYILLWMLTTGMTIWVSLSGGMVGEEIVNVSGVEWGWGLKENEMAGQAVMPTTEKTGCSNTGRKRRYQC